MDSSPKEFSEGATLLKKVMSALQLDWFQCFAEMVAMVCHVVGQESRWMEGCYCHEDLLRQHDTWRTRTRAMRESEGSGAYPWKGKQLTSFPLGHVA